MRGSDFHFAYVLTAGDHIVHLGAGVVSKPEPSAVDAYLLKVHAASLFWDDRDYQFCPSGEAASNLLASMRIEHRLRCAEEETSPSSS
jgi:hypothetical protein